MLKKEDLYNKKIWVGDDKELAEKIHILAKIKGFKVYFKEVGKGYYFDGKNKKGREHIIGSEWLTITNNKDYFYGCESATFEEIDRDFLGL